MRKTRNKNAPEVRERAVRMVLEHERNHGSRQVAVVAIQARIGCAAQTLHDRVKKAEVDAGGRTGDPTEVAARLKRGSSHRSAVSTKAMAREEPSRSTTFKWRVQTRAALYAPIGERLELGPKRRCRSIGVWGQGSSCRRRYFFQIHQPVASPTAKPTSTSSQISPNSQIIER